MTGFAGLSLCPVLVCDGVEEGQREWGIEIIQVQSMLQPGDSIVSPRTD